MGLFDAEGYKEMRKNATREAIMHSLSLESEPVRERRTDCGAAETLT